MPDLKYFVIYKPFGVLSQFSEADGHPGLASLYNFPRDVYPVGRLDRDSEGMLIITNDKKLNHKLLNPEFAHNRTYMVQVEGDANFETIKQLENRLEIKVNKKTYLTKPAKAKLIETPSYIPERNPPVRFRKSIPTSWIELTLIEGKNRQVRKMTAKTGFPTLRLIRKSIENLELLEFEPGSVQELDRAIIYKKLNLK
ncbi:pseudouridine synthase [Chondrinema litorale]|uniref:pseudouridine synthase n=1 Tax=Chondrinema litorale TaxID=2994555 RepID=UPI00254355F3|nr:pseudouridine synthase [Chondrinema litorale]UZR93284.1 pseudouridine synthase [Chondrinema litorale]